MREKALLISVAAMLVVAAPALVLGEENLGGQTSATAPAIETLGFLGKGIASLPSDPTNFKIVKVGVAKMKVTVNDTETKVAIGVLFLDEEKFRIRNVAIENGSATGDLYRNDTMAGSISVKSVIKEDTEVWAGTLTVDGTTYNVHILQAPRIMKKNEWREKLREYCRETGNCSAGIESYCENNPTDTRCLALFKAFCIRKNNIDDSRCREFMKGWCKDNPEETDCRLFAIERSENYCKEHPNTPVCNAIQKKLEDFCATDADHGKCRGFCQQNPDKCRSIVRNLAEFCLDNANHSECLEYCKNKPKACVRLAANLAVRCMQEPNRDECREYCNEHPVQCRIVTAELARFCIGNAGNPRCAD
ncbi:MAG: hypothetical protein QXN71_02310, partial [Candidatus Aenigmatarchaeota archaeon]